MSTYFSQSFSNQGILSIFYFIFFKKITSQQLFVKKIKVENKLKVSKLENEWLMCLQRATLTFKDEVARKKRRAEADF